MSIAAALVVAPTAQPQTAGGKAASQAEGGESFATILDHVSGSEEQTNAAVAVPTQLPVQPQAAVLTLETGELVAEAQNAALTFEQILAGASQPEAAAEAVPVDAQTAQAAPAQATAGGAVATPAADPAATQAALAAVRATTATPAIAKSANSTASADGEAEGTYAAEGAEASADGTTATQSAATGIVTAAPGTPTALALGQAGDAPIAEVTAEPVGAATASATPTGDESAAEAPKAGAATNAAAPAAAAADNSAAKGSVAPAVDVAAQPVAPTQTTTPQSTIADALAAPTAGGDAKTQATPAALQSAPAATIQVYSRIIERADGRAQRFEIRLDPAELGRVDVRIEIGADRKVHAVLAAHDSAALSDLMRGQRALERALADAGIDLADKGVRFELATDGGREGASQRQDGQSNASQRNNVWRGFDTLAMPADAETAAVAQPARRSQRLNLVA